MDKQRLEEQVKAELNGEVYKHKKMWRMVKDGKSYADIAQEVGKTPTEVMEILYNDAVTYSALFKTAIAMKKLTKREAK